MRSFKLVLWANALRKPAVIKDVVLCKHFLDKEGYALNPRHEGAIAYSSRLSRASAVRHDALFLRVATVQYRKNGICSNPIGALQAFFA